MYNNFTSDSYKKYIKSSYKTLLILNLMLTAEIISKKDFTEYSLKYCLNN